MVVKVTLKLYWTVERGWSNKSDNNSVIIESIQLYRERNIRPLPFSYCKPSFLVSSRQPVRNRTEKRRTAVCTWTEVVSVSWDNDGNTLETDGACESSGQKRKDGTDEPVIFFPVALFTPSTQIQKQRWLALISAIVNDYSFYLSSVIWTFPTPHPLQWCQVSVINREVTD